MSTPDPSTLSFEDALRALEQIVRRLESGDVPLDESIALYAQGEELRKRCADRLQAAEARMGELQAKATEAELRATQAAAQVVGGGVGEEGEWQARGGGGNPQTKIPPTTKINEK